MEKIIATVNVPWSDVVGLAEEFIDKKFLVVEFRVAPIDRNAVEARIELLLKEQEPSITDDSLEVTKEWLEQNEFVNPDKVAIHFWIHPTGVCVRWSNEVFSMYWNELNWLCHNPTRGDVRQVIRMKQLWNRKR